MMQLKETMVIEVFIFKDTSRFFTRGQFWPSGIVVACVCLCVCVSVCPSIMSLSER